MQDLDDLALLREYAANNSEAAYAELVARRIGFVYSAALRQVRDPHLAGEITQAVFIILAQKAGKISDPGWLRRPRRSEDRRRGVAATNLIGWLFKTTRYVAIAQTREIVKQSLRTATIEKEFQMQTELQSAATDPLWQQMSPLLDEALAALGETDRQAVLLRFFENKSLAEVGNYLGIGEDTARKRVSRALEKLHRYFNRRGVSSTTAIIAGAISTHSIHAAPIGLAKTISAVAVAKGAATSSSTLTLIKGALKIMAWTKAKTAIVVSVTILFVTGAATVTVKEIHKHKTYSWQMMKDFRPPWSFEQMPQQVEILPTRFQQQKYPGPRANETVSDGRFIGITQPIQAIIERAFHVQHPVRIIYPVELPTNKYDFIATLKRGSGEAMQQKLKDKFGLVGRFELVETNVLALKIKYPDALKLKPSTAKVGSDQIGNGDISSIGGTMDDLANNLEDHFRIPVINQTGLTNNYDFEISWDDYQGGYPDLNGLKQALPEQLGLELVPTNTPIEMLVVEKVK